MIRLLSWNTTDVNSAGLCRLADAFAIERIAFVRKPKSWAAAVGTQGHVHYEFAADPHATLAQWRSHGFAIVAIEQGDDAAMLGRCDLPEDVAFVLGNEGGGVPPSVLAMADMTVEIPQWGLCGSLNVATTGAIVLYEWARQHRTDWPRSANAWKKRHGEQHREVLA